MPPGARQCRQGNLQISWKEVHCARILVGQVLRLDQLGVRREGLAMSTAGLEDAGRYFVEQPRDSEVLLEEGGGPLDRRGESPPERGDRGNGAAGRGKGPP